MKRKGRWRKCRRCNGTGWTLETVRDAITAYYRGAKLPGDCVSATVSQTCTACRGFGAIRVKKGGAK